MDISTAALLGQLVGSVIAIYLLHVIWEFALFKRVMDDPVKGKFASVIAAYLSAGTLAGFATAAGGPFNPRGFVIYLFGAAIVGFFAIRRGMTLRDQATPEEAIEETFG